jgi:RNA polymerase sigma-70 factor, ECF subfamily
MSNALRIVSGGTRSGAVRVDRPMKMVPEEAAIAGYENEGLMSADRAGAASAIDFDQIFERYHSMVYQLCCRFLGDRDEALDLCQEVLLVIYREINRFRGDSSLKTWIYRVAVNRASNRCRWWNRLRRRGTVSLDEHLAQESKGCLADSLATADRSPEEVLLQQEEREWIENSLQCLPLPQRIAVVMRDIEGLTYEEIAETTGASLGTVKSRIARGRDELKKRLNGRLG